MKVALAPRYRNWMLALLPTTLGVGTLALWLRSLNWPCHIDEAGVTFRYRRRVDWRSVRKICVSRSYRDGHVSRIRIRYTGGASTIPVDRLQDGQEVVRIMLAMFEQANRARAYTRGLQANAARGPSANYIPGTTSPVRPHAPSARPHAALNGRSAQREVDVWAQELAALRLTLESRAEKLRSTG